MMWDNVPRMIITSFVYAIYIGMHICIQRRKEIFGKYRPKRLSVRQGQLIHDSQNDFYIQHLSMFFHIVFDGGQYNTSKQYSMVDQCAVYKLKMK